MLWLVVLMLSTCWAQLRVGGGLNIFGRFGYLTISMRVLPRNDTENWIFREPVIDVFTDVIATRSLPGKGASNKVFHGDFHMEFCEDTTQLLQAYFREFIVERLEKPWRAFTGSWTETTMARNLGINATFIGPGYSYVLVRVSRHRDVSRLADSFSVRAANLQQSIEAQTQSLQVGDIAGVAKFIRSFGSHYVNSYVTGNSLYQVMVYTPNIYKKVKTRLQEKGVSGLPSSELHSLFSPWYAEHLGVILAASGNSSLTTWARTRLGVRSYLRSFQSLLKLHGNTGLLRELDSLLGNEALLQLRLDSLASVFKDQEKSTWFEEVMDNNLKLWEVNM